MHTYWLLLLQICISYIVHIIHSLKWSSASCNKAPFSCYLFYPWLHLKFDQINCTSYLGVMLDLQNQLFHANRTDIAIESMEGWDERRRKITSLTENTEHKGTQHQWRESLCHWVTTKILFPLHIYIFIRRALSLKRTHN